MINGPIFTANSMLIRFPFTGVLERFGQDDAWKRSSDDVTQPFALECAVEIIEFNCFVLRCKIISLF